MLMRALTTLTALALLALCCACSSNAFAPARDIIHVDRSASAVNSTVKVTIQVLVEAPSDPRVVDASGNLFYTDEATARIHERWLKAGIREDARMEDFIKFSEATEYSWWQGGGGVKLVLLGKPDMTRLALRWGKFFPDVVKDLQLSTPAYSRTTATPGVTADPRYEPASYYQYNEPYNNSYNGGYNSGYNGSFSDVYGSISRGCGITASNCTCGGGCCGLPYASTPAPKAGVDKASGPFVRR
jgi:hypothetical protein